MQCGCGGMVRETTSHRKCGTRTDTRWCEACGRMERRMRYLEIDTGWNAPGETVEAYVRSGAPALRAEYETYER